MMNQMVVRLHSQLPREGFSECASIVDAKMGEPSGILKRVFTGMITLSRHSREDPYFFLCYNDSVVA